MPRDNKRQRQSGESEKTSPAPSTPATPMRAGEVAIDAFVESLRKEAQLPLAKSSKSYLRDFAAIKSKLETYGKINNDEDFIPRSARLSFSIKSDKDTSELETFKALKEETDVIVSETKKKLRKKILDSMTIEINNRNKKLLSALFDGLKLCTRVALAETGSADKHENAAIRDVYADLTTKIEEHSIFNSTELDNGISTRFPPDFNAAAVPEKVTTRTSELFTALFLVPIKQWSAAHEEKKIRDRLQKLNVNMVQEATNNAVVAMDTEESVSPQKLADLIKEAVSKETAALRKEVAALKSEKKQPAKKETRGRRSGASEKQKQSRSKSRKVRFANEKERADDADNDSSRDGGILRPSKYRSSHQKKKQGSKNSSNRRNKGQQQK